MRGGTETEEEKKQQLEAEEAEEAERLRLEEDKNKVIKTEAQIKNESSKNTDDEEETAPEFKVLKAIPSEGITLEALIYKVGESIRDGMGICLKNKWIYKNGDLIMRATSESFNKDESKKEPENKSTETKEEPKPTVETNEVKKPKTVRKKKTDTEEAKPASEEKKPEEKKQKAPRKKKTDTTA
jgi:cell division septation protein DedD